jgi:hypothetical protein
MITLLPVAETITWIKVEKPAFNLVGVILGALAATGVLVICSVVLGLLLGVLTIVRRQRQASPPDAIVRLNLSRRSSEQS